MYENKDVMEIAHMLTSLNELAYSAYAPIVDEICLRKASESVVEHLLDYMVGFCNDERMLGLFKRICRKYLPIYPEMITSEIYTYKNIYDEE